jgi:hypothetical protein
MRAHWRALSGALLICQLLYYTAMAQWQWEVTMIVPSWYNFKYQNDLLEVLTPWPSVALLPDFGMDGYAVPVGSPLFRYVSPTQSETM